MQAPFNPIQPIQSNILPISGSPLASTFGAPIEAPLGGEESAAPSFQNVFAKALGTVNDQMNVSGQMGDLLAAGKLENVHEMTLAGAKAGVMLKLTTQIAARISSAATTLFQMQL